MRFRLPALAAGLALLNATAVASAATSPTAYTTHGAWTFRSAPRLHPPKLRTDAKGVKSSLAPGYFLVANFKNILSSKKFAGQGGPLILVQDGNPIEKNLRAERLQVDDVAEEARENGIESLDQIKWCVLETGGSMSFIQKSG